MHDDDSELSLLDDLVIPHTRCDTNIYKQKRSNQKSQACWARRDPMLSKTLQKGFQIIVHVLPYQSGRQQNTLNHGSPHEWSCHHRHYSGRD